MEGIQQTHKANKQTQSLGTFKLRVPNCCEKKMAFTPMRTPLLPKYCSGWTSPDKYDWITWTKTGKPSRIQEVSYFILEREETRDFCFQYHKLIYMQYSGKGQHNYPCAAAHPAESDLIRWGDDAGTLWCVPRVLPWCSVGEVTPLDPGESSIGL